MFVCVLLAGLKMKTPGIIRRTQSKIDLLKSPECFNYAIA